MPPRRALACPTPGGAHVALSRPLRTFWRRTARVWLAALLLAVPTRPATAIIFHSSDDPAKNTTAPGGALANSGWQFQGVWGNFLGTPVSPNYFITAKHVGGNVGNVFSLNGTNYTTIARVAATNADLSLWKIEGIFPSFAPLYTAPTEVGRDLVVFGRGTQRGTPVEVNSVLKGWRWGPGDGLKRWGENTVAGIADGGNAFGDLLRAEFNATGGSNEAHLSVGDSSGAVFIDDSGIWKLAGINYSVDGMFNTADSGSGFNAAIFDQGGLYVGTAGNWNLVNDQQADIPSNFYATRISTNADWIKGVTNFWKSEFGGNWSTASRWSGGVPNAVDAQANLLNAITTPRTITVDLPVVLGGLTFHNANKYTLAGANTITLDVSNGSATIEVYGGSHEITAPLVINDPLTITAAGSSGMTLSGHLTNSTGKTLTKTGTGTLHISGMQSHGAGAVLNVGAGLVHLNTDGGVNLSLQANAATQLNASQHLAALSVGAGATVKLSAGGSKVLDTRALAIDPTGMLDLADNDLIIRATPATRAAVLAEVTNWINSGFNGAAWNGFGIASSAAAADVNFLTSLGVMLNDDGLGAPFVNSFAGETVDANSILVKYTYYGDADLNGVIDGTDYALIDNGFNAALTGWFNGDFSHDGVIDGTDYALIDNAFNSQTGPLSAKAGVPLASLQVVPEPSTLALAAVAGLALAGWAVKRPRRRP